MNTEWKLVNALRDSLLWTASSLAAIGKEQDVITLEGRKRTVGEILDEANEALNVPDDAAPTSHPIPTGATGEDERAADPLNIRFTPVSDGLPDLVEYSPSYAGQWSSNWCVVITARGNIESSRLVLSSSGKEALEAARFNGVWRSGIGSSRVVAWAYMDHIRSAADAAAIAQQKGEA